MNKIKFITSGLSGPVFTLVIVTILLVIITVATSAALFIGSLLPPTQKLTTTVSIPANMFCGADGIFYIRNNHITSAVWNTNAQRQYICVDTDTQIIVK